MKEFIDQWHSVGIDVAQKLAKGDQKNFEAIRNSIFAALAIIYKTVPPEHRVPDRMTEVIARAAMSA